MRFGVFAAWGFLLIATIISVPAAAAVGDIDIKNLYPFVVKVDSDAGGCTGAASRAGLVSTAAHCVWDDRNRSYAGNLTVTFDDADGYTRRVKAHRVFIPAEYPAAARKWIASKTDGSSLNDVQANFHRMTLHDIAFIVPNSWVETEGFPHWATEILPETGVLTRDTITQSFGDLNQRRALTIGYGNYTCADFSNREENCKIDGNRRIAEMPLKPKVTVAGEEFAAPFIWCTGIGDAGTNPVQHGDSGGPLFVKALDGRWIFMGYNSGGNAFHSCASSLLANLGTWRQAAAYIDERIAEGHLRGGADHWEEHQMARAVEEMLQSWSSPNEQALLALPNYYSDDVLYCEERLEKSDLLARKTKFAQRWPSRRFAVKHGTGEYKPDELGEPERIAGYRATIVWDIADPSSGRLASGESDVEFDIRYGFEREERLLNGVNTAKVISVVFHSTTGNEDTSECVPRKKKVSSGVSLWNHNQSIVRLVADGTARSFYYETPRDGLGSVGIKKGTLLFEGKRVGDKYAGTAYVFSKRCGPRPYEVAGEVQNDQKTVVLRGQMSRIDANCQVVGYQNDVLTFDYQEQN